MKTLYLECSMGAAGDMLASALLELVDDGEEFVKRLNSTGIPNVKFIKETSEKCAVTGTHLKVLVNGETEHEHEHEHEHGHEHEHEHGHRESHSHSSMSSIEKTVSALKVSEKIKNEIIGVYKIIAEAESTVHARPVAEIHFHEVGALDAIADITAVCMLMEEIGAGQIISSAVNTGSGTVNCAHGTLPVPAPATALILKGIPSYSSGIGSELCTPTGAALLKYFCTDYGDRPPFAVEKIGYGMGSKDFETANCLRAFLGKSRDMAARITELSFNVDDMTGEEIGFLTEALFNGGAKEVFTMAAGMKKSRPGTLICVICDERDRDKMLSIIFKNSTTIGVRESIKNRYTLERTTKTVSTPYGEVRKKISSGFGVEREKYEYEDLKRIANENSFSLQTAREKVKQYDGQK